MQMKETSAGAQKKQRDENLDEKMNGKHKSCEIFCKLVG